MKGKIDIQLNQIRDVLVVFACIAACISAGAEPELKTIPQEGRAHPGHAYRITCEVSWTGKPSDFFILPAEADPIDWGTAVLAESKAFVREDADGARNVVSQTLEITPNKTGTFKTPAIRIAYFNPEATPPAESAAPQAAAPGTAPPVSSASPSLGADPFDLTVYSDRSPIWISGGLGASLLLTALGWWSARRLRRPQPTPNDDRVSGLGSRVSEEPADTALKQARAHRLEGDFYKFYSELAHAAETLPSDGNGPQLAAILKTRAQETGYRGVRPTDDQMDGDLRELERAMAAARETGR